MQLKGFLVAACSMMASMMDEGGADMDDNDNDDEHEDLVLSQYRYT